jgi:beta-lysine 5,6-aminomutase alpha subunit
LDQARIARCRHRARQIVGALMPEIKARSTDSIERAVLRFWGVEGGLKGGIPLVNAVVERLKRAGRIAGGVAAPVAALVARTGRPVGEICAEIAAGGVEWLSEAECAEPATRATARELSERGRERILAAVADRSARLQGLGESAPPWLYVIVATGDIYADVEQARCAVSAGGDCIAVIRSTAQSLLDYVPEGATTEGFGGTYATGKNFAIMREALDQAGLEAGRYIRLVNYASGLCMPEITVLAALHRLDMLLNDSIYGIIFRDIHRMRTLVDQYVSRRLCAAARIIINTGEDNYLTTADAVEAAHTVLASQFINESFALEAGLPPSLMGLGHAFEVDPRLENSLLYELATALLVRAVFPEAPIKYMPPTRHKTGDIFFSHALDCMFNLASVATEQAIHLCGMLTEALHTPFLQDRFISLETARYIRSAASDLRDEITFRPGGFISRRAAAVLAETEQLLDRIARGGLLQALAEGVFADIKRPADGGRGAEGVFTKSDSYLDAFEGVGL